ncbi:MAG: hemerythrin domain-containing protein [Phycisphaerales bacterium]|nr:hemerythrin domain-containing protein [Phycisphaerae bacterium]NNF43860.1 hemerythrin domain-containing protein [Phycisphaerales bacterium]NNM26324.1 hemerythrin domain-containing protein [Phycisphaerales bacterium]
MMQPSTLRKEFIADHQEMIRGLARLVAALSEGDGRAAAKIADEIDVVVGPHIQFEEEVYYPQLRMEMGDEPVDRFYEEHAEGLEAVRGLLALGPDHHYSSEELTTLLREAETALRHAESCGRMLSHLTVLPAERQSELLSRLRGFRRAGVRWTACGRRSELRR